MQLAGLSIDRGIAGRWGPGKGREMEEGKVRGVGAAEQHSHLLGMASRQSSGTFSIVTCDYLRGAGRFDLDLISLSTTQPWFDQSYCGTCLMN